MAKSSQSPKSEYVVVDGREYLAVCAPKSEKKSSVRKSFEIECEHRAEAAYQGLPWEEEF